MCVFKIINTTKIGQIHFEWKGDFKKLFDTFPQIKKCIVQETEHITHNMRERGGGISDIELLNLTHLEEDYYQIKFSFDTCDSMGANFINSVLEEASKSLTAFINASADANTTLSKWT